MSLRNIIPLNNSYIKPKFFINKSPEYHIQLDTPKKIINMQYNNISVKTNQTMDYKSYVNYIDKGTTVDVEHHRESSNLFISKYKNLAPARHIYNNVDFRAVLSTIGNVKKNQWNSNNNKDRNVALYKNNHSKIVCNPKTEKLDDVLFSSISEANFSPQSLSYVEDVGSNHIFYDINKYEFETSVNPIVDRSKTGKSEMNSEILDDWNTEIKPFYKIFPLDIVLKTPTLALQFNVSDLHINYSQDPRINKRFIKY